METIASKLNDVHNLFEERGYDIELLSYIYNLYDYSYFNKTYQYKIREILNLIDGGCYKNRSLDIKQDGKEGFKVKIYDEEGKDDSLITLNKGKDVLISYDECDYSYPYEEKDELYSEVQNIFELYHENN